MGNEAVPSVAAGNCIAARVALLCMVAIVRGIFWCEFGLEVVIFAWRFAPWNVNVGWLRTVLTTWQQVLDVQVPPFLICDTIKFNVFGFEKWSRTLDDRYNCKVNVVKYGFILVISNVDIDTWDGIKPHHRQSSRAHPVWRIVHISAMCSHQWVHIFSEECGWATLTTGRVNLPNFGVLGCWVLFGKFFLPSKCLSFKLFPLACAKNISNIYIYMYIHEVFSFREDQPLSKSFKDFWYLYEPAAASPDIYDLYNRFWGQMWNHFPPVSHVRFRRGCRNLQKACISVRGSQMDGSMWQGENVYDRVGHIRLDSGNMWPSYFWNENCKRLGSSFRFLCRVHPTTCDAYLSWIS